MNHLYGIHIHMIHSVLNFKSDKWAGTLVWIDLKYTRKNRKTRKMLFLINCIVLVIYCSSHCQFDLIYRETSMCCFSLLLIITQIDTRPLVNADGTFEFYVCTLTPSARGKEHSRKPSEFIFWIELLPNSFNKGLCSLLNQMFLSLITLLQVWRLPLLLPKTPLKQGSIF